MAGCGCNDEESIYASDIKWDGNKLVCGSTVIKPCESLADVITKMFKMRCVVMYNTQRFPGGASPAIPLVDGSYTVPVGGAGIYEVQYSCNVTLVSPIVAIPPFPEVQIEARKNGVVIDTESMRVTSNNEATGITIKTVIYYFLSEISLAEGDVLAIYGLKTTPALIGNGVIQVIKIG